ncbi:MULTISPECIES: daptide biosynthesis RiPP recognition protein [unclassified Streptomyces]|uniref:daptide biosynthesis RiPP recognition protein n=1 Tax=unclassified Streptomyces TaxID=2593676 RepID=UPI002E296213|nr:daptide biosynthesis RiPP recognition protein [Streptomyces sp. NBC_00223]
MNARKQHLMAWVTGRSYGLELPERGAAVAVLADGADLEWLVKGGLVAPEGVVYAPSAAPVDGVTVVPYHGSFTEPGSEVQLGEDFFLQVQAYSIASFLALLGPTVVRVADGEDAEAFVADAEQALHQGVWSEVLTNPAVQLADVAVLGGRAPQDGRSLRLYVGPDHGVRVGLLGTVLGKADAGWEALEDSAPDPSRIPGGRAAAEAVRERHWLARYHSALQAVQSLRARGRQNVKVSGFGMRLNEGLELGAGAPDLCDPLAPVLLESADEHYVYAPSTSRVFQAAPDTARTLERVLVRPDADDQDSPAVAEARRFLEAAAGRAVS